MNCFGGYLAVMAGLTKNIDSYTVGSETWDFYGIIRIL